MNIHLPPSLESPILDAVHSGRYATLDDAMAEAAALPIELLKHEKAQPDVHQHSSRRLKFRKSRSGTRFSI